MNDKIKKILKLKEDGFLFHGSPNSEIKELSPRLTSGTDPDAGFNYDTAVFATNDVASSVIFAVVSRNALPPEISKGKWYMNWYQDKGCIARIPEEWKPYVEEYIGSLYVLDNSTFTEKQGFQFKSKVSVIPVEKIDVTLQDAIDLGATIEWI